MSKMRVLLVVFGLMLGYVGNTQVYGEIGIAKRKVAKDCERKITSSASEGLIVIAVVVNRDGNVTSSTLDETRTTVSNTMLVREAMMRSKKMKFEADYTAPTYHKGLIEFKVEKVTGGNEELKKKNVLPQNY